MEMLTLYCIYDEVLDSSALKTFLKHVVNYYNCVTGLKASISKVVCVAAKATNSICMMGNLNKSIKEVKAI